MFSFELMKTIAIFALITLVACDTINPVCHNPVTVSPANPVQFWPVDCQTYNEKEVCGIYSRCYCQPFNCSDEIKIQISDDQGDSFSLVIESEEGTEIEEIEFTQNESSGGQLLPDLDDFETSGGSGNPWVVGVAPSVTYATLDVGSSERLQALKTISTGFYRVDFDISFNGGSFLGSVNLLLLKDGAIVSTTQLVDNLDPAPAISSVFLNVTQEIDQVAIRATSSNTGSERVFTVNSLEMFLMSYSYDASFVPDDLGICDEKILLRIYNTTASPRVEEYRSDCLDIRTEHQCTNLIEYSNNRNYAGLVYTNVSPEPSFQIRVRSIFFHEELPQEDFVMELTSGIEKTSGVITAQRRFDVDRVPYYMHKKLILIFEHQSILIDGAYWTKQERYEMIENQKQTFPMKKGQVLLTMRDFVQRSVL